MTTALATAVARALGAEVSELQPLGGGDVALSYCVSLRDGRVVFAKTHRTAPPGFFVTEAEGLRWLRAAGALPVPDVLAVGDGEDDSIQFLVLEWIDALGSSRGSGAREAQFGRDLAALHAAGAPCYGREDRRTTGSRSLPNEPVPNWATFYAESRLLPLAHLAEIEGVLSNAEVDALRRVASNLHAVAGSEESPSRLHGDLWAGNRLVDGDGTSWLIDPAAHGGHREFDLAMMRLFGGFGHEVFAGYEAVAPLTPGWEERVPLHQLAPLVVHAIKFGGTYVGATADALRRCEQWQ